jgi:hypothetical protein
VTSETFLDLDERRSENLQSLFVDSHRAFVPIREGFLQVRGRPPLPGPLGDLVRGRHHHALDFYLLLHAATASPPHRVYINPDFWAVLVRTPSQSLRNARLALYRSLEILEHVGLIRRDNKLGVPLIQLLDERGQGDLYFHPAREEERYFTLPYSYWRWDYDRKLGLPGKAVLLIARSLKPEGFTLPLAHAQAWYGISADTFRRGAKELVKAGLLRYTSNAVPSRDAPDGITIRRTYKLAGAMARTGNPRTD